MQVHCVNFWLKLSKKSGVILYNMENFNFSAEKICFVHNYPLESNRMLHFGFHKGRMGQWRKEEEK